MYTTIKPKQIVFLTFLSYSKSIKERKRDTMRTIFMFMCTIVFVFILTACNGDEGVPEGLDYQTPPEGYDYVEQITHGDFITAVYQGEATHEEALDDFTSWIETAGGLSTDIVPLDVGLNLEEYVVFESPEHDEYLVFYTASTSDEITIYLKVITSDYVPSDTVLTTDVEGIDPSVIVRYPNAVRYDFMHRETVYDGVLHEVIFNYYLIEAESIAAVLDFYKNVYGSSNFDLDHESEFELGYEQDGMRISIAVFESNEYPGYHELRIGYRNPIS